MIQTMLMMKTSQSEQPVGEDEGVEGVGCLAVSHLKYLSFIFLPPGMDGWMIFWIETYLHLHSIGGKQSEKKEI